ncbi:RNA polymerase sigma factor, partial [Vibrio parahaemolyticus]
RHAATVHRVCVAILKDHHAAEDATQATFLALARSAKSLRNRSSVLSWLHRTGFRIALRAARTQKRQAESRGDLSNIAK